MDAVTFSNKETCNAAHALIGRGDFSSARRSLERSILIAPSEAKFHWLLGVCHAEMHDTLVAYDYFRRAVQLDPSLAPAQACMGNWYLTHGMVEPALRASAAAVALWPTDSKVALSRARILEAAGEFDAAWDLASRLIDKQAINPGTLRVYARMARYRNQQPRALSLTLKLLGEGRLSVNERVGLHFTAADLLDSLQRYDEAFTHAAAGNAAASPPYDPRVHERTFDIFIDYFTADRLRNLARSVDTSTKPVFIVGMPRSGSSMIEQILASHPDIHGGGELDFMQHIFTGIVAMLGGKPDYPGSLNRLTVDQATGMGQIYLQPLMAMSPSSRYITDKLPLNFLHLGLINLLLPGARIIHCRRDAMDTCLSCHMNSFKSGHDFKFDLAHLGLFYRQYQRLMEHWSKALDLPMLDVDYEDVVTDPQGQTRRLLHFLDLPYNPACLDFHQTQRPVLTSSMQQVRQPLYSSAVHRWKHYEKHLAPLKNALGPSRG